MKTTSVCLFGERELGVRRAFFEITNQCNMLCKHCMNNSGENSKRELKKEEIKQLLDELKLYQIQHLYISGGEPLLYYAIDEVLEYAYQLGIKIVLATNGIEIKKHLPTIKKYVDAVSVSLDGIGETHDRFRGVIGAYDKLVNALDILQSESIVTKMSTIIWKGNMNQISEIVSLAKKKGVVKLNLNMIVPEGRAKDNSDIIIPPDKYPNLYSKVEELIELNNNDAFTVDMKRRSIIDANSKPCPGGKTMFHINAIGKVAPCSWLSKIDGSNDFSEMWEKGNLGKCLDKCKKIDSVLSERELKYGYAGCPALAEIQNGSYLSEDPINKIIKQNTIL